MSVWFFPCLGIAILLIIFLLIYINFLSNPTSSTITYYKGEPKVVNGGSSTDLFLEKERIRRVGSILTSQQQNHYVQSLTTPTEELMIISADVNNSFDIRGKHKIQQTNELILITKL